MKFEVFCTSYSFCRKGFLYPHWPEMRNLFMSSNLLNLFFRLSTNVFISDKKSCQKLTQEVLFLAWKNTTCDYHTKNRVFWCLHEKKFSHARKRTSTRMYTLRCTVHYIFEVCDKSIEIQDGYVMMSFLIVEEKKFHCEGILWHLNHHQTCCLDSANKKIHKDLYSFNILIHLRIFFNFKWGYFRNA